MDPLDDQQFRLLGERLKDAWDKSLGSDETAWLRFKAEIKLRNMCVRWFTPPGGGVHVWLEEHTDRIDAYEAVRLNDGSVKPLRSIGWNRTLNPEGWVLL